jgi:misacylated tRNA(Ala) deacylase
VHTALHLLSVVIPLPVTGGQIGAEKGRLDFDMPEPPADVAALEERAERLIARDLEVTDHWITDAELLANPGLVKTMSVRPPMGQGRVRLVRIGAGRRPDRPATLRRHPRRPHRRDRPVEIDKIEKKGRHEPPHVDHLRLIGACRIVASGRASRRPPGAEGCPALLSAQDRL